MDKYPFLKGAVSGVVWACALTFNISLAHLVHAQPEREARHYRPSHVLEVSLMGLRESAAQVAKRNEWLMSEIAIFRRNIQLLERDLQALKNGTPEVSMKDLPPDEEKLFDAPAPERFEQRRQPSNQQNRILEQQGYLRSDRLRQEDRNEQDMYRRIDALKRDIRYLRDQLQSAPLPKEQQSPANEDLKFLIEKSEDNLVELRKELDRVKRKFGKPLKDFNELYEKNSFLKEKLAILQEDYKKAAQEEMDLEKGLKSLKEKKTEVSESLDKSIAKLQSKQEKLEKVLKKARRKIDRNELDFTIADEEFEQLMENLYVIQNENNMLQEERSSLETALKNLQSEASQ